MKANDTRTETVARNATTNPIAAEETKTHSAATQEAQETQRLPERPEEMNLFEIFVVVPSLIAFGYTLGMMHWVVMDCRRRDKEDAEWQARRDADLVHEIIEGSKR